MELASGLVAAWLRATPGGDQLDAMFGDFSLGVNVYAAIAGIATGIAIVTGFAGCWAGPPMPGSGLATSSATGAWAAIPMLHQGCSRLTPRSCST